MQLNQVQQFLTLADGPTSIFLCGKLGQTEYMGPIAVAAYSYMSLVPIIQPPIMKK